MGCPRTPRGRAEGLEKVGSLEKFEEDCANHAQQRDGRRKAGEERLKHAAEKVAELQGKLTRDPSEWD